MQKKKEINIQKHNMLCEKVSDPTTKTDTNKREMQIKH